MHLPFDTIHPLEGWTDVDLEKKMRFPDGKGGHQRESLNYLKVCNGKVDRLLEGFMKQLEEDPMVDQVLAKFHAALDKT